MLNRSTRSVNCWGSSAASPMKCYCSAIRFQGQRRLIQVKACSGRRAAVHVLKHGDVLKEPEFRLRGGISRGAFKEA
jgi:hypothetical protein